MDCLQETVSKDQVKPTLKRLVEKVKAQGYSALTLSRELPTKLWDVIVVPFKKDDPKERFDELNRQIAALMEAGFQMTAFADVTKVSKRQSAEMAPSEVSFQLPG